MLSLDVPPRERLSLDVTLLLDLRIQLRRRRLILNNLFLCGYMHYARRTGRISSGTSAKAPTPFSTPRAWASLGRALDLVEARGQLTPTVRLALAVGRLSLADAEAYGNQFPAYRENPMRETLRAVVERSAYSVRPDR